jgi:Tol biopolymer transport system component
MRSNGKSQRSLNTPGGEPAWSPDGRRIAFHNDLATWTMASDGTDRRLLASVQEFDDGGGTAEWIPEKPDWSPDGRELVLQYSFNGACEGCFKLARVPAAGGEAVEIARYDVAAGGAPSWSPDGTEIAAHDWHGLRSFAVAEGATARFLLTGENFAYSFPAWQPLPVRARPAR